MKTRSTFGPVETQVRADIDKLITGHPMAEALAAMSYALAHALDEGAGMAAAAVNRELRNNLIELARLGVDDDDLESRLSRPTGGTSEVRNRKDP